MKRLAEAEGRYLSIAAGGPRSHEDRVLWEMRKHACGQALSDETLELLRGFDPSDVMHALASEGIVLDPASYVKYAMGADMGPLKGHMDEIRRACSGACSRLAAGGGAYELCNDATYDVDDFFRFRTAACKVASACRGQGSIDEDCARERAVLNTAGGVPAEIPMVKNSGGKSFSPLAEAVAGKYISYKLAAVDAIRSMRGELDDRQLALIAARSLIINK
jgi:hypothetical protein